jgi:hypothetical protein
VNATGGRGLAAIGGVLAIAGIFLDAYLSTSYWDIDGTFAWFGLILGALALALAAAAYAGNPMDGWLFGIGAFLVGYWGFFPAVLAFAQWDDTGVGLWMTLAGAILIAVGIALPALASGTARSTPSGASSSMLAAGLGIVLIFPSIWLDASGGVSYWDASGHSLGVVLLVLTIVGALAWAGSITGAPTKGADLAVSLILLGLFAATPVESAFNDLGSVDVGGWLGLAGAILAAGGIWAARGDELPRCRVGVGEKRRDCPELRDSP